MKIERSTRSFRLDVRASDKGWLRPLLRVESWLAQVDTGLVIGALFIATTLAGLGAILRNLALPSSAWFDLLPRYATLVIGFGGAALATRGGEHIALDLLSRFLPARWARGPQVYADALASLVAGVLALATWELIGAEREGGSRILGTIPSWTPLGFLGWGLAVTSFRFALRAAHRYSPAALLLPAVALAVFFAAEHATEALFWLTLAGLIAGLVCGTPLFVLVGGLALLFFWYDGESIAVVPVEIYRLTEAPALVTLPLFTLLGTMLSHSEAPRRLVRVARAWLGWAPGGLAMATVVVCAFFTTFTGASGVTILALGLLLHQLLTSEGYSDRLALGLVTASGSIGLLFAPALPLIVYAVVAKVDIDHIFAAGATPGLLLIVMVAGAALLLSRRAGLTRHPFSLGEAKAAMMAAGWDLLLPVLILGLIISGLATVAEAAAIGVLTCALVFLIKRDLSPRDLPAIFRESAVLIGAVLVILGVALAFTYLLVDREVPQAVVAAAQENIESRWVFLLALNLLLLVVGCLLDIFSAIIIFVPLVMPVALAFGVNPIHLGVIFLANLEIGYLTPPVGLNLFLSSFRFQRELPQIWRSTAAFLLVLLVALLVITYVPQLSLWWLAD